MPFNPKKPPKDLKKKIKKRHPKAGAKEIRQWMHVFNNAIKDGESEARAFAKAWGVLNRSSKLKDSHVKTNPKETIKQVKKWERKNKKSKKAFDLGVLYNFLVKNGEVDEAEQLKYIVEKSEIEGEGDFAIEDVKKNEIIGLAFKLVNEDAKKEDEKYKGTELGAKINHSKEPNIKLKNIDGDFFYISIINIDKGKELTVDYRSFPWEGEREFANE